MENGEPLWDPKKDEKTLRLPKTPKLNKTDVKDEGKSETSYVAVIPPEKSKLNVSASEFVPKCYLDTSSQNMSKKSGFSVQNRLKIHKDAQNSPVNYSHGDNRNSEASNNDFRRVKQLISTLTNDPGQFDNLLDIFKQTLLSYSNNHKDNEALTEVIELLVKEAIQHQSFRYTAARLCYSIEQESLDFTAQLCVVCKRELEVNPNKQGTVMFVSELFTQPCNQKVYGKSLTNSFEKLLNEGGDVNIKCVCQALKLTGHLLEINDKDALNKVMEQLINIKQREVVTGTAACLLDSVLSLRGAKWGYNDVDPLDDDENIYWEDEAISTDTVFYNSEGDKLTNEETAFLAANLQSTDEYLLDSSDPDELCDPEPEMDEEIQKAFKEFVKLSKR